MNDDVRKERTGWRDQEISARHREWGFNCPAVDLDFFVAEYNKGLPVGLVEYKHHYARMPVVDHPTYRAIKALCDGYCDVSVDPPKRDPLPFMIVFYWPDVWAFKVFPINEISNEHFKYAEALTEREYVMRLYKMRRLALAKDLEGKLRNDLPPPA